MAREPVPPSVARNCGTNLQAIAEQQSDIESGSNGVGKVAGITTQYDKELYEAEPNNITSANCNPSTNDSKGYVDGGSVIEKVLSRVVSQKTLTDPGPPPDGGLKAWLVVLGGHLVVMNTWGVIVSFGIFQTYYTSSLGKSRFAISWIGSSQIFLLFFVGTFTGRASDAGYTRLLMIIGICLQMISIFTASVATEYWQIFLAQGICFGLGNGCLFCPTVATVSTYFSSHRILAIGITACGTATGGLVFPSIARMMLPEHGAGWTLRTMGFVQLVSLIVAFFLVKPRIPPRISGRLVEWAAFKDLAYTYYTVGNFFCFLGLYFAFHYLSSFSRSNVTPVLTYEGSLDLLMVLNGVGIAGRIVPNYFSDSLGLLNMYIPLSFLSGVLILCWMAVTTRDGIYAWSIFYGIFAAGVQGLFPAGLSTLTPDLSKQGSRIGMAFTIVSFAVLAGPPIEGGLIQAMDGKYYAAQVFAGGCTIIGSLFIFAARMVKAKSVQKPGQSIWKMRV
ncbi:hypothetical protein Cpir12675_004594 [Ceratocystis pirilliformis]|uniref:Major facilitator superfamily (MFS) profile domain-containing protein n=1 Tax=Ceratocystis pirilliformis TaxID=259994 RepID=A0ABR3YW83_9PEZI